MNINEGGDAGHRGEGGQKDRPFRQQRGPRPPREERPPRVEADPNSNYKLYYEKDQRFFLTILKEEEPGESGHEFKLQLFKHPSYEASDNEALKAFGYQPFDDYVAQTLFDYDVTSFKSQTHYPGEQFDKHRILFTIKDKEKAIKFWQDYMSKALFFEGCRYMAYLQKPEDLFVRYGDQEAAKYYAEQERLQKEYEEYEQNRQQQKQNRLYQTQSEGSKGQYHDGGERKKGRDRHGGDRNNRRGQ